MKLSIIIPVFNEEKSIAEVLSRVVALQIPKWQKEIIVINDGSTDKTVQKVALFIKKNAKEKILFLNEKQNNGKGAAVKKGIQRATGEYIVIQDADTEYNPQDILRLVRALSDTKSVVYGTRLKHIPTFNGELNKTLFILHYIGNRFLSLVTSVFYGQWITDMETCYKLFPRSAMARITLHAKGFELEPEITAKLLKQHFAIIEVPITTKPRGYEEGKKLNALTDGPRALWTLLKYRFID